ncbi:MAG: nitrate reductase, partial [Mesorhizobium sp.]
FSHPSPADIFAEHAALSAFENDGARDFDIGAYAGVDAETYEELAPFQWPAPSQGTPLWPAGQAGRPEGGVQAGHSSASTRFFANGNFYTPDGKARFIPIR